MTEPYADQLAIVESMAKNGSGLQDDALRAVLARLAVLEKSAAAMEERKQIDDSLEPISKILSIDRIITQLASLTAVYPVLTDAGEALVSLQRERAELRKELASRPGGEPVAYAAQDDNPDHDTSFFAVIPVKRDMVWESQPPFGNLNGICKAGECVPLYAGPPIATPQPPYDAGIVLSDEPMATAAVVGRLADEFCRVTRRAQPPAPQGETVRLNIDHQRSRAVHRVVRAMHDGECPKCHALYGSDQMIVHGHAPPGSPRHHRCPRCGFEITAEECAAAMGEFARFMEENLVIFEEWRATLPTVQAVVVQETQP